MANQNLQIRSKTYAKLKFAFQASAFSWSNFWHFEFSSSNSPNDHHHSTKWKKWLGHCKRPIARV